MVPAPTHEAPAGSPARGGARLALLLLLPAALLAWPGPGGPLWRLPVAVEITAVGVAALALLPAALVCVLGGAIPAGGRTLYVFLAVLAAALVAHAAGERTDTLEASRALLTLWTAFAALCAGAALGSAGRVVLVRGIVVVSIGLTAVALLWRIVEPARAWAGVLGNAGELASAALPGAVAGALVAVGSPGTEAADRADPGAPWRRAGFAAVALFLLHAALSGQRAGPLALCAALGWPVLFGASAARRRTAVVAAIALSVVALTWLGAPSGDAALDAQGTAPSAVAEESAPRASAGGGGARVRLLVWRRATRLLRDHALLGVGPGQFATEFPPYRDAAEIEISTWGHAIGETTEVEHPHDDWLLGVVELGLLGGLAWIVYLLSVALAGARAARGSDRCLAAAGAAALAVLVDAVFNGPLLYNPCASTLAFACAGVAAAGDATGAGTSTPARRLAARALPAVAALGLLVGAPRAWSLVRHGRALADWTALALSAPRDGVDALEAGRIVARALEACPDSVVAHTLRARIARSSGGDAGDAYRTVLALRPHRFEALVNLGQDHARRGELAPARELFEEALRLDPGAPALLRNLVRLELTEGRLERGLHHLEALTSGGHLDEVWVLDLATWLLLRGQAREALPLLERVDLELVPATGEEVWAASKVQRAAGDERLGDALESHAHRLWARDHAERGRAGDAVRSYRQNLRLTGGAAGNPPEGPVRVRLELAAALVLAGRADEAATTVAGLAASGEDWTAIPEWARDALRSSGLLDLGAKVPD